MRPLCAHYSQRFQRPDTCTGFINLPAHDSDLSLVSGAGRFGRHIVDTRSMRKFRIESGRRLPAMRVQ